MRPNGVVLPYRHWELLCVKLHEKKRKQERGVSRGSEDVVRRGSGHSPLGTVFPGDTGIKKRQDFALMTVGDICLMTSGFHELLWISFLGS